MDNNVHEPERPETTPSAVDAIDEDLWKSLEGKKLVPILEILMEKFGLSKIETADYAGMDRSAFTKLLKGDHRQFSPANVDHIMTHIRERFEITPGAFHAWRMALCVAAHLHHEYNLAMNRRKDDWDPKVWKGIESSFWTNLYQFFAEQYLQSEGPVPVLLPAFPRIEEAWHECWGWIKVPKGYRVSHITKDEYRLTSTFWPLDGLRGTRKIKNLGPHLRVENTGLGTYHIYTVINIPNEPVSSPLLETVCEPAIPREPEEKKSKPQEDRSSTKRLNFEPELIHIPAGEFWMGSRDVDKDAGDYEKPCHKVWLDGYWIGRYPVTVAQFRAFTESTKYRTEAERNNDEYPWRRPMERSSHLPGKDQHPVVCVTWNDAQAYCRWLRKKTGRNYRLPTEAQWEKAARGTDEWIYAWGSSFPSKELGNIENWFIDTTPVGMFSPAGDSFYGCSDMTGNVWEWCLDWYDGNYYSHSPVRNPMGPANGIWRVLRGGSWGSSQKIARCAFRFWDDPGNFPNNVGFRLVSPRRFLDADR